MHTFDCPRCFGKGRINAFSHVIAGVCFKCNGVGTITQKSKPRVSKKFAIGIVIKGGEELFPLFHINAANVTQAVSKAEAQLSRGAYDVTNVWADAEYHS